MQNEVHAEICDKDCEFELNANGTSNFFFTGYYNA